MPPTPAPSNPSPLFLLLGVVILACGTPPVRGAAAPDRFRVLVLSKTAGYRHDSIPTGRRAIARLGAEQGFAVEAVESTEVFTPDGLASFDVIVFLNTTGDVLDEDQQSALVRHIHRGGGFVGVHAAADTEQDWPWYGRLLGGAWFNGHPPVQEATVLVHDRHHPATAGLPARWERRDEWYDFRVSPRGAVHVLASLDERTYEGGAMAGDHPIAWCHDFEGGRVFYTGGGHTEEAYEEREFLTHLLGGIVWAAGRADADVGATRSDHFEKVVLDDEVTDPMELAVARDGRVFFVERGGVIKIWKPDLERTVIAGFLDVFTGLEDGLLGIALDPVFAETGWIYLMYAPEGPEPHNVVSRFTLVDDAIVEGSERILLSIPTQRDECCHSGGSLAFGPYGNLFISTGDNTSPFASNGYSPIDERPGRDPFDAQKSSANTHDLRGKVLRIRPRPDGTYDVPKDNLFAADGSQGRPEIYVMGCRNPFRISVDPVTGTLYWGEVGPDAGSPNVERGPAGHDEFNRATGPGNFGWPYFVGPNLAYHDYDFASGAHGEAFDPDLPRNDSPNNTGRAELPPAQPAWIGYPYGESTIHPALGSGGRCAMAGPVYHLDPEATNRHRLPAYYDGMLFIYEWARDWIMAVDVDDDGEIIAMHRFAPGMTLLRPMDLEMGSDGCLYLIEWGMGFGGGNTDSLISRIEYYPSGNRPPRARVTAEVTSGPVPLTVHFDGSASAARGTDHTLRYAWDFDGDGRSDARTPTVTRTFTRAGTYPVQLEVKDAKGIRATATLTVTAGNTRPEVTFNWPPSGGVCGFGDFVRFEITARDAEDGTIDPSDVVVQPFLGHDTHAHPLDRTNGLGGTFQTLRDDGHGANADLFTVVHATYTDRGAGEVAELSARDELILQPRRKQLEYTSRHSGARLEKTTDGGGQAVVFDGHGHVAIEPLCLTGLTAARLRVAAGPLGGTVELRLDKPDGPLAGRVTIPSTGLFETAGSTHRLRVEHFERGGGAGVILRVQPRGRAKRVVPAEWLSHEGHGGEPLPGLHTSFYALTEPSRLPDFETLTPDTRTTVANIDFASTSGVFLTSGHADDIGTVFDGFIRLAAGAYAFTLESDDGSRLLIDDAVIIDNDGLHGMVEKSAGFTWSTRETPLPDDGLTHVLYVVAGSAGPLKLDWIEFEGTGVSVSPPRVQDAGRNDHHDGDDRGHDHDHDHH